MSTPSQLPSYIERIRAHLLSERGMTEDKATATAIATATMFCKSGRSPNLPVRVNAASRAEACAAVAQLKGEPDMSKPEPAKVTDRPFDPSPARFSDTQWARSCVLDRGGDAPIKQRHSLPIREPEGTLNLLAMHEATRRLGGVKASAAAIRAGARALVAAFREAGVQPPESLLRLAGMAEKANQPKPEERDLEQRTIDVDVEDLDTRGRTIVGYAAVYNRQSHDLGGFVEQIAPGAFADVLGADVRCLLNHDPNQVLGRTRSGTLRLLDEERGLRFECDLPDSPVGENVREAVRRGDVDGASFRFKVASGGERWEGEKRTVTRVAELHDVTIATFGGYPDASIELRTRPNPKTKKKEEPMEVEEEIEETEEEVEVEPVEHERRREVEQRTRGGGLQVEERTEHGGEERTLLGSFKRAGWAPGTRAEIAWPEYLNASEQRALTFDGSAEGVSVLRRDGLPLGADRRYAWPAFPSVGVDSGTTSVDVLRQTDRTLPSAADVVRAIDAVTAKPEADSEVKVVALPLKQVAAVQKGVPNVYLETPQIKSIIGQDLRLAVNSGLDKLVLDALAGAGFQDPGTDPLLVSIRKAITTIQAAGYDPNTLILTPEDAEALDVLQTSGPEEQWVFGAGRFAPGELFGLSVRVSVGAPAPVVVDSRVFGRMYVSPIGLQTFEENAGETNTSLLRMEGHAVFGRERTDAAVRIAAA